jgi:hypothetical protein
MNLIDKYKRKRFRDLHEGDFITILGFAENAYVILNKKVKLGSQYRITEITPCYYCQSGHNWVEFKECPNSNLEIQIKVAEPDPICCCYFILGDECGRPLLK